MTGLQSMRDRIRALGFDYPDKYTAWAIGNRLREEWVKSPLSDGELPEKGLRTKTSGKGSHCFAHYPPEFFPEMDAMISKVFKARASQLWLPFAEDDDEVTE